MELGLLLIVAASAVAGLALRAGMSRALSRLLLAVGLGALILGIAVLGLTVRGWSPFGIRTGALVAVVLLGVAALVLPLAVAASCGR